jgi:hypothetical protein
MGEPLCHLFDGADQLPEAVIALHGSWLALFSVADHLFADHLSTGYARMPRLDDVRHPNRVSLE